MIFTNHSLLPYNTFGIETTAKTFVTYTSTEELQDFLRNTTSIQKPLFILGGGSNVLFTKHFEGTIIHPQNKGIHILTEDAETITVSVEAGEIWDDFVAWAVERNVYGVENLSAIPGCVGASPVQNIGAYGMEASQTISKVHTIEIKTGNPKTFTNKDCKFGYRQSIFKQEATDKYIVTSVEFILRKQDEIKSEYGTIKQVLETYENINLHSLRNAIISIRNEKLPSVEEFGNAGSFFKNPIITKTTLEHIQKQFANVVFYPISDSEVKIAAGWLIETLGLKGYSIGGAKVHEKQALVIINTGTATSADILALSKHIQKTVLDKTGINIEPEVIFI